uniref:Uncharacterized protein n=1 Tax=Anguilla anguilla TaxID=7936 RepID=A0A0E9W826_ANGAN
MFLHKCCTRTVTVFMLESLRCYCSNTAPRNSSCFDSVDQRKVQ